MYLVTDVSLPCHCVVTYRVSCVPCRLGMYKRWIKRSTSSKRDSGTEEDALSNSHGSIASSYAIGPEEDEQEMVEVLLRVMNVVEFWIEHHYKVSVAVVVVGGCGGWVWLVGVVGRCDW